MTTLLIDTATDTLVVGLASSGELLAEALDEERRAQALLDVVHDVLVSAGVERSDLRDVAVGVGPGGFTGLRVGVATARGIAAALGIPLAPIPTLAAVAQPLASQHDGVAVWASVDAKRGERFMCRYRRVSGVAGFSMIAEGDVLTVRSEDVPALVGSDPVAAGAPTAAALCELAQLAPYGDPALVVPQYGRDPDAVPAAAAGTAGGSAR